MGLLNTLKEKYTASKSFGRVSEKADIGIDVDKKTTKKAANDDLFESKDEMRARNRAAMQKRVGQIQGGIVKVQKGRDSFAKMMGDLGDMIPGESSSKGRRKSSNDFGFSMGGFGGGFSAKDIGWPSTNDLIGNGGGRKSSGKRKGSSTRGLVPIYRGSKVVGYKASGGRKKRAKAKSIFDIDI